MAHLDVSGMDIGAGTDTDQSGPDGATSARAQPTQRAAEVSAASAAQVTAVAQPGAGEVAAQQSIVERRRDERAALPRMAEATLAQAVANCQTLVLVPLRGGTAEDCYFNEATSRAEIDKAVRGIVAHIDAAIRAVDANSSLAAISPDGKVEVKTQRANSYKNRCKGTFAVRVLAQHADMLGLLLSTGSPQALAIVSPMDTSALSHEVVVEGSEFYPGAVMEQIYQQNTGLRSAVVYDAGLRANVYKFTPNAEQLAAIEMRGHAVKLGDYGTFQLREVEQRITWEQVAFYGCTGLGSARDFMLPEVAGALGLSTDMVRVRQADGIRRGAGFVGMFSFPYSQQHYSRLLQLLDIANFKILIGRHALSITVAATPVELGELVGMRLTEKAAEEEAEIEEVPPALDLRIGAQHGIKLVPARVWLLAKAAAREAAAIGQSRMAIGGTRVDVVSVAPHASTPCGKCATAGPNAQLRLYKCASVLDASAQAEARSGTRASHETEPDPHAWGSWNVEHRRARMGTGRRVVGRCEWEVRAMNHLLGWGFDARACGALMGK
jgi:hypothetical protein